MSEFFRAIESAIDKDFIHYCIHERQPFSKFSRKAILLFKSPQSDILQTHLDRLKNTMLLMMNGIVYASQIRKKEAEMLKEDQEALIEILMQQKRKSDQKFERLDRAIKSAAPDEPSAFVTSPVNINTGRVKVPETTSSKESD